ncbi:hypothetical protein MRX96_025360 [Rhipicephalus microplus]
MECRMQCFGYGGYIDAKSAFFPTTDRPYRNLRDISHLLTFIAIAGALSRYLLLYHAGTNLAVSSSCEKRLVPPSTVLLEPEVHVKSVDKGGRAEMACRFWSVRF